MVKKNLVAVMVALSVTLATPAHAIDAASVQKYCDDVKASAQAAMKRDIVLRQPSKSPSSVFEDSVKSCMEHISSMGIGINIPGIGDITGMLQSLAKKMLDMACQAAKDEFDSAVNDAMDKVNKPFDDMNSVPGINGGVEINNSGGISTGNGGSVSDVIGNQGNQAIGGFNFN